MQHYIFFSYKGYGGHRKGGYGIVNCNPRCTYCPNEPKMDTFYFTYGSPMYFIVCHPFLKLDSYRKLGLTFSSKFYSRLVRTLLFYYVLLSFIKYEEHFFDRRNILLPHTLFWNFPNILTSNQKAPVRQKSSSIEINI